MISSSVAQKLEFEGDGDAYRGELPDAKREYGRAIDAYLVVGDADGGIRTCRKLIRLAPDVVRTRYTLLCLLSAQRQWPAAQEALADYLASVLATGTSAYAVPRLVLLGSVTDEPRLRRALGAALRELGADADGANLIAHAEAAGAGLWPAPAPRVRREQLFRLARL